MNVNYSNEIMEIFNQPQHVYTSKDSFDIIGYVGELPYGEYVHLYFSIDKQENYIESKITQAKFSAIGGVMLIAAAEKFCSLVEGISFHDAMKYCDPQTGLANILSAPEEKMYSVNFVLHAFYKALETLTNQ